MRKVHLITACVLLLSLLCTMSACANSKFFSQDTLRDNLISDLPKIPCKKAESSNGKFYDVETTEKQFNEYVVAVYSYLKTLNFKYLGFRGNEISGGAFPIYEFHIGNEIDDFKYTQDGNKFGNCYIFVWANEIDESTSILNHHYITLRFNAGKSKGLYNCSIEMGYVWASYKLV